VTGKKIVHVSHRYWPCLGGVETHVRELCEKLAADGVKSRVVCLNKCPNSGNELKASEKVNGVKVERVGFWDLGFYKIAPGVFGKLGKADTVHVHGIGFFSDFLALTRPFHGKRLVLSTHGGIFHTNRKSFLKRAYFFGWCRLALRTFDKVIAVSKTDYKLFAKILPKKKLELIENPIDLKKFTSLKGKKRDKSFLFVGRLSKNKGLKGLLRCFAEVKASRADFSLSIAGKEFDLSVKELREEARKLGIAEQVNVLGQVSDKRLLELYAKSEFFVSASEYEGFGISAVEAMASGSIPLLNNIAAFKRFVKDRENGFIVDFSKKKKAAAIVLEAIWLGQGEKRKLRENAKEFAEGFSWKKGIKSFEKAYKG